MRCGVVGLGFMGTSRVAALRRAPSVTSISGIDQDLTRSRAVVGDQGNADSFEKLLARGLDALFVCTPDPSHTSFVIDALERGIPVFVEKPMATTIEDCRRISAADAQSKAFVTVGHSLRVNPRYAAVQHRLASGGIGDLLNVATRRNWPLEEGLRMARSTNLAMYLAVHEIDLLHWLAGKPIVRVYAVAPPVSELPLNQPPTIAVLCTFSDGAIATVETSWAVPDGAGFSASDATLQVMGTRGVIRATCPDLGAVAFGDPTDVPHAPSGADYGTGHGHFEYLPPMFPEGLHVDEIELETHRFLRAIGVDDAAPLVSAADGAAAVAVAVAIQQSLHSGEVVDVTDVTMQGGES